MFQRFIAFLSVFFIGFCSELPASTGDPSMPLLLDEGPDGGRGALRRRNVNRSGNGHELDQIHDRSHFEHPFAWDQEPELSAQNCLSSSRVKYSRICKNIRSFIQSHNHHGEEQANPQVQIALDRSDAMLQLLQRYRHRPFLRKALFLLCELVELDIKGDEENPHGFGFLRLQSWVDLNTSHARRLFREFTVIAGKEKGFDLNAFDLLVDNEMTDSLEMLGFPQRRRLSRGGYGYLQNERDE